MEFESKSVDFIEKLIGHEIKVFLDYLRHEGLVDRSIDFDEIYMNFRRVGYEKKEHLEEYEILTSELEDLYRQTKIKAYHIFSKQQRPILKSIYPGAPSKEITKKISELWKSLDPEQKAKYKK